MKDILPRIEYWAGWDAYKESEISDQLMDKGNMTAEILEGAVNDQEIDVNKELKKLEENGMVRSKKMGKIRVSYFPDYPMLAASVSEDFMDYKRKMKARKEKLKM